VLIRVIAVFRVNLALGIVGGTIKSFARRERPSPANELRRGTIPKAILVNIEEKVEPAPPDDDECSLHYHIIMSIIGLYC